MTNSTACLEMGYSLRQWEWPDSLPVTEVAETYPALGLESTEWFKRNLSLILMAPTEPNHRWWALPLHKDAVSQES